MSILNNKQVINRNAGFDFIHSDYGVFSDEMKIYQSLRGQKAVQYLLSLGYTDDKSKWIHITYNYGVCCVATKKEI